MNPAPPVTNWFMSLQIDRAMVTDHHPGRARALTAAHDLDIPADQRVGQPGDADDAAVLEDDGVLDLGVDNLAVVGNGGERTDVRVHEPRVGADHCRAAHG